MEDHKLKVFCTVAETKSFSKASEIIHLTQPAVSLQIQALEELYETKLFDRSSSSVKLTKTGETLYKYAKQILSLYADAEKIIGDMTGLVKGSISVGASTTIGNHLLPIIVSEFKKTRPKIKLHMRVGNTKRIIELLNSGNIDFGIVEGEIAKQKIKNEVLLSDELCVIVPAYHMWAKKKDISIFELPKEPFILREEGSGTRQVIEKYLADHGITVQSMKIALILGSTEAIKEAVENGLGVSIVSKWAARKETRYGTLKLLSIKEEKMMRDFTLISGRNYVPTHAVDEFLSYLRTYKADKLLNVT